MTTEETITPEGEPPRRLTRSSSDRVLGGVCSGIGRYLGVDPVVVRVVAVVLVFFGGAGVAAYIAAWLLVPSDDPNAAPGRGRAATVAGVVFLVLALGAVLPFHGWGWGGGLWFALFIVVLGLAGLGAWWLATGTGRAPDGTDVLRRAGLGLALLALCGVLALGGAWAAAAGGGVAVAIAVIVAGAALVVGAFLGGARWLILPALALALPAGVVGAADFDVKGGVGERIYRPATVNDLRTQYRLGVGRLVVDLRGVHLPPGDHHIKLKLGMGEALVEVPPDICVVSRAHLGVGGVNVYSRRTGGADVDFQDARIAPARTPRVIVDGDIGIGAFRIQNSEHGNGGGDACHGS